MIRRSIAIGSTLGVLLVVFIFFVVSSESRNSTPLDRPRSQDAGLRLHAAATNSDDQNLTKNTPGQARDASADVTEDDAKAQTGASTDRRYSPEEIARIRAEVREESIQRVGEIYPFIMKSLYLTKGQEEALMALLVEAEIARTRTAGSDGRGLDKDDFSNRIAGIIGESKQKEFLKLDSYRGEYAEALRVGSILAGQDVPLTETQRDGLLKILVDVRDQIAEMPLPALEPRSLAALEFRLDQMDDYERLVVELAPSVLTAEQVEHLFDRYQALSYQRAEALEAQREARANDPTKSNVPLWYPPRK